MQVLDKDKLLQLGTRLKSKFSMLEAERRQLEIQWLKNLRQYKGIYDPEVKIPEGRSRVYPKDTHTKIVGWVAKMMEMMFPAQEKNWSLGSTSVPNISEQDLQQVLKNLQDQAVQAQQQGTQPGQPPAPFVPPTSDDIEKAVKDFAEQRALKMEQECEDQLCDEGVDYPELCKKTIRRAGIYGFGVIEGPLVKMTRERVWEPDATGKFVAISRDVPRPYYETVKAWDIYPDLSARRWEDQDGLFTRKIFSRHGLLNLGKRDDFFGDVIDEYLSEHQKGNYQYRPYEPELMVVKHTERTPPDMTRQYEIYRWYGYIPAKDLAEIGVAVPESAMQKDILSDIWLLDGIPIKADMAPFGEKISDMFHVYIPEEDEDGPLTGTAKVENLRDSQLKICSVDRATMDNMAESASSIKEVNKDLLASGQAIGDISGGMTIQRTGDGNEANYPAVRCYDVPNHTESLIRLRDKYVEIFDQESNLPAWRMGNAQPLGEAFRTTNNMSMMQQGGDMVTKDDVRAFDRLVKSLIGSLVTWNMEFNPKKDIKGDFDVQPQGSISLVAKEVRGAALDQLNASLTPRERAIVDERRMLLDRLKSRDLPVDYVASPDDCKKIFAQMDEQQAQQAQLATQEQQAKTGKLTGEGQRAAAQAQEILATQNAKINALVAKATEALAKGKGVNDAGQRDSLKLLLEQIGQTTAPGGSVPNPKS